jgi:hypothetical protein
LAENRRNHPDVLWMVLVQSAGVYRRRYSAGLKAMAKFLGVEKLFEGRHFDREIIVLCVRWYLRFKLSFRDLVDMMASCVGCTITLRSLSAVGTGSRGRLEHRGVWTRHM